MCKRTSVKLNPSTHRRLKLAAAATSMCMNVIVEEALMEWMRVNHKRIQIQPVSDEVQSSSRNQQSKAKAHIAGVANGS